MSDRINYLSKFDWMEALPEHKSCFGCGEPTEIAELKDIDDFEYCPKCVADIEGFDEKFGESASQFDARENSRAFAQKMALMSAVGMIASFFLGYYISALEAAHTVTEALNR